MKKVKFFSVCIIVLSVIAIGIVSGKQMFRFLEASSTSGPSHSAPGTASDHEGTAQGVRTQILYTNPDDTPTTVPAPETKPRSRDSALAAAEAGPTPAPPASGAANGEPAFDPKGEPWVAFATGNGINVRSGPGTTEKLLWKVGKGTKGSVLEKKDGWTHVKWDFNRKSGWVRDDLLFQGPKRLMTGLVHNVGGVDQISSETVKLANQKVALTALKTSSAIAKPAPVAETVKGYTSGAELPKHGTIFATSMANVRSAPSATAARVGRLPKGVVVQITGVKKVDRYNWFEISYNDGKKTGWTREDNLKF